MLLSCSCFAVAEPYLMKRLFDPNVKLKKTDGKRNGKLIIATLDDAYMADTDKSQDCTLILTQGDTAKAFAVSCLACLFFYSTCIHINNLQCLLLFAEVWIICCGPRLLWRVSFRW